MLNANCDHFHASEEHMIFVNEFYVEFNIHLYGDFCMTNEYV